MTDFQLALAHYAILFPDLAALGAGSPPVTWKAEYDRVAESGLGASLVTGASDGAGASVQGSRNFDQRILLEALHLRRAQLDATYLPFSATALDLRPAQNLGITVFIGQ